MLSYMMETADLAQLQKGDLQLLQPPIYVIYWVEGQSTNIVKFTSALVTSIPDMPGFDFLLLCPCKTVKLLSPVSCCTVSNH